MIMFREIDLSKKPKKSLLKKPTEERKKSNKTIKWDWETIEAQQLDMKLNPPLMRIEEPKTPYDPYEKEDCAYLEKVRRMFRVQPTVKINIFILLFQQEVLDDVSRELAKIPQRKNSNDNIKGNSEFIEVNTIDDNGNISKDIVSKEHHNNIEFLKKRKIAYENEFIKAENFVEKGLEDKYKNNFVELSEEDKREVELDDRTLKNTIINKFSHIILKKEKMKDLENKNKNEEDKKENEIHEKEENKKENDKDENNNKKEELKNECDNKEKDCENEDKKNE